MTTRARLAHCVVSAIPQGMKTVLWLLKLTIPVSFGVFLLNFFGKNQLSFIIQPVIKSPA
jgi:hypothetical protein